MFNCCGSNHCGLDEKFDFRVENSDEGITINITPKDKSKVKSLQKLVESHRDFFGSGCC